MENKKIKIKKHHKKKENESSNNQNDTISIENKINNKEEKDNSTIYAVIIFLIICGAVILSIKYLPGLLNNNDFNDTQPASTSYMYNGLLFQKQQDGLWYTKGKYNNNEYIIPFRQDPKSLDNEQITSEYNLSKILEKDTIYITTKANYSSYAAVAIIDLTRILSSNYNILNKEVNVGLVDANKINATQINCNTNITSDEIILNFIVNNSYDNIMIKKSLENDNCIQIIAKNEKDLTNASTYIQYKLLGIIN